MRLCVVGRLASAGSFREKMKAACKPATPRRALLNFLCLPFQAQELSDVLLFFPNWASAPHSFYVLLPPHVL